MTYQQNIKDHLTAYKKDKYPTSKNGIWRPKTDNKILEYAFWNWGKDYEYNILEPYRDNFFQSMTVKRHTYFHHMNSSQAMCINFFYPLMVENRLELITDFLNFPNETISSHSAEFEKESEIDGKNGNRATNFDFYFQTVSGKEFFFEIKYTEYDFGKAKNDQSHVKKFNEIYKHKLGCINPEYAEMQSFFKHYQIIRNLIHVGKDKYVVFLYPEANKKIKESAAEAKEQILKSEFRSHLFDVHWEDIVAFVQSKVKENRLIENIKEFEEKYITK